MDTYELLKLFKEMANDRCKMEVKFLIGELYRF